MPNEYQFSLGNSSEGPVGFCIGVTAESPEEALQILRGKMPLEFQIDATLQDPRMGTLRVYFNPEAITVADIEETLTEDEAGCGKCVDCGTQCASGGEGSVLCPVCDAVSEVPNGR